MECNKDEALRSKAIAEARFLEHDYAGARKFVQKARQLFPELEGLPQFVSVLDVHVVAQEKLQGGETNWYAILQVDSTADENTIRKQYRKLALLLHPDKNKSVGAEAAFKYLSEAWGVLSDKVKKIAYDARCAKAYQVIKPPTSNGTHNVSRFSTPFMPPPQPQPPPQQFPPPQPPQSHPPHAPSYHQPLQHPQPQPQPPQSQQHPVPPYRPPTPLYNPPVASPSPRLMTFWTACPSCKMQLEYQSIYVNKNLCCPVCYKPFFSREVAPVSGIVLWPPPEQQGFRVDGFINVPANGLKSNPFLSGNFPSPSYSSMNAAKGVTPQMSEKVKESPDIPLQRPAVEKMKLQRKWEREEIKAKAAAHAKEVFNRLIAKSKGVIEQKLSADKEKKAMSGKASSLKSPPTVKSPSSTNGTGSGKENKSVHGIEDTVKVESSSAGVTTISPRKSPRGKRMEPSTDPDLHEDLSAKKARLESVSDEKVSKGFGTHTASKDSKLPAQGSTEKVSKRVGTHTTSKDSKLPATSQRSGEKASKGVGTKTTSKDSKPPATSQRSDEKTSKGVGMNTTRKDSKPPATSQGSEEKASKGVGTNTTRKDSKPPATSQGSEEKASKGVSMHTTNKDTKPKATSQGLDGNTGKCSSDSDDAIPDVAINVPDPEFYDFDSDRTEQHFLAGQIWAAYDDEDGMPRYYTKINKVVSVQPFKIQMYWLEARTNGSSSICGDFKLGKSLISEQLNTFSHMVTFERGPRGTHKIYPMHGDIWAVYKDSGNGNSGFEIVEILSNYSDEVGVQVSELVKVEGFRTLYRRQAGEAQVKWISARDLHKFSHQVPAHCLTAEQVPSVPECCWELDPAATPMELITGKQIE